MSAMQPRMTQDQRSALTKDKLARAAFEVIRDVGYAGFRTAAVAKAAGVSQGGQLHHFPTKDDLALAAVEYGNALANAQNRRKPRALFVRRRTDRGDHRRQHGLLLLGFVRRSNRRREVRLAERRAAARHRRFAAGTFRDFAERGWLEKLVERGWSVSDAQDIIDLSTSLVRGFAIRKWIHRDTGQYKRLLDRWVDIVYASFATPSQRRARPVPDNRSIEGNSEGGHDGFRIAERKRSAPPGSARVVRCAPERHRHGTRQGRLRRAALAAAVGSECGTGTATDHRRRTAARRHLAAEQLRSRSTTAAFRSCCTARRSSRTATCGRRYPARKSWCQLFSEPSSGSDLASLRTQAVRDGDHYVINGSKIWTSLAHKAAVGIMVARTNPAERKHKGLSTFIIDMHAPGVEVRPIDDMTGFPNEYNQCFFTDVRVPVGNRDRR